MSHANHPLMPRGYALRKIDSDLDILLNSYKIVEIEGVLGCGKSWTALNHAQSATTLSDTELVLPIIQANTHLALIGAAPHLVDDWSSIPDLYESMYHEAGRTGSYIAVSSYVEDSQDIYAQKYASRGIKIRMRPCTLAELGHSNGQVPWNDLVQGRFIPGASSLDLGQTADFICAGGWPAGMGLNEEGGRRAAEHCVEDALLQAASIYKKKVPTASAVLTAIADGAGSDSGYPALAKLVENLNTKAPSRTTMSTYIGILDKLCLIEKIPGWNAPIRSSSRVRTKHRLFPVDCSVGTVMRQFAGPDLLQDAPMLHSCLKSMALHELICRVDSPVSATPGRVCYYSDADGLDIDFIVLFEDGSWAPINVELGERHVPSSAKRIARLYRKLSANPHCELKPPAFSAIILGASTRRWKEDIAGASVFPINDLS